VPPRERRGKRCQYLFFRKPLRGAPGGGQRAVSSRQPAVGSRQKTRAGTDGRWAIEHRRFTKSENRFIFTPETVDNRYGGKRCQERCQVPFFRRGTGTRERCQRERCQVPFSFRKDAVGFGHGSGAAGQKVSTFFSQGDRYLFRPPRISATRSKEAGRMVPRVGWGMPLRSSDCKPP
jgi:hypothetical protein